VRQEISSPDSSLGEAPTAELIELALRQTGDLVRAEASLVKAELEENALGAIVAAVNMVATVVLFVLTVALNTINTLLILETNLPTTLLTTAGILVVFGLVAAIAGIHMAPKGVLGRSRERVAAEIHHIEDHAS